jgi:hypothetical protein
MMKSRQQGKGNVGIPKDYIEEPMTKPMMIAL